MEQTATNPQTGEKIVFRGGQWQPINGAPSSPAPSGPISSGFKPVDPFKARDQQIQEADFQMKLEDRADKAATKQADADKIVNAKTYAADSVRVLLKQLDDLEADARDNSGWGETGTTGNIMRAVPIVSNAGKDLAGKLEPIKASNAFTALSGLAEQGIKLTPISNAEIALAAASISNLDPSMSQEAFLAAIQTAREKYGATLKALEQSAGQQAEPSNMAAAAGADQSTNIIDPNAPVTGGGPSYKAGPVESYVTDADRARSDQLQAAYNKGAGPAELNRLAQELGTQPFPVEDMRVLMEARSRGEQVSIRPFATGKQGLIESAISTVSDSPVGAYGIGAANALTLGGLDEIAGAVGGESAGQRAQFAKDYSRENSPVASMIGEVAGFAGATAIPGVTAPLATVRGGATLGGIYGALDTNDNRLLGAGLGELTGGAANKYAPQAINALTQFAQPAVQGTRNALTAVSNRLPGAEGRAIARQEVAQNADIIAAGQAEGINVRQPDVRPSLRDQYGGAEASQYGGPKIQKAASEDAQAIADRLAAIGGNGTPNKGYSLGSAAQDAVNAEKAAIKGQAGALYRRADLQAPNFKTQAVEASRIVGEKIDGIKRLTPEGNEAQIAFLQKLENNLTSTGVSVESLQANRDLIRSKMKQDNLSFTKAETDLLDVINAASRDLEKGLQDSGNAAALQTLKRANAEWQKYSEFKKDVVKTIVGTKNQQVTPEQAAQRLLSMVSTNGPSDKFAKIYKALPTDEKANFKALVAENLGKNTNGEFSLAFLAKNLTDKKANLKSLQEVFDADEFQSLMNLRTLARAKVDAMGGKNFSNTARAANNGSTGFGGFVRGALGFQMGDAVGAAVAVAGPNLAERIGTKRTVDMLLNTDFSKWLSNMPNTNNPRAIDAYLKKLDNIKAPAVASNVVIFKDYLRQVATQSPGKLAASENEGDGRPIPPQQ